MDKAAPPIEYTSSMLLADSWWQAMQRAGFTVRFYFEEYGSPNTRHPPQLIDSPTRFGGWVYKDETLLGAVAWNWCSAKADMVVCRIISKPPQGDILHWILIGSGIKNPTLALEGASASFLRECLGGVEKLYEVDDRFWHAWSDFIRERDLQADACSLLPILEPPYFASTLVIDSRWRRNHFVDVCTAPIAAVLGPVEKHVVVVRARNRSSRLETALRELEVATLQSGGKSIDVFP